MVLTRIVGASALTTLGALPVFLLGVQSAYVREDLGFGPAVLGMAVSCFFACAAVGSLLLGALVDRVSERTSMVLAGSLSAGGGAGIVLATHSSTGLILWLSVLGWGNAACQVTANHRIARAIPARRRGFGFAVKQAAIPIAVLVAGLSVPLAASPAGWRAPYVVTGASGLLVVALGLVRRPTPTSGGDATAADDQPALWPLSLLMIAMTLASASANATASFVASWGHQLGVSPTRVGTVMAVGSGLNIAVRLLSGALADRRHGRNLPVVAGQMFIGAGAVLVLSSAQPQAFVPATIVAFALGWSWPGLLMFAAVRVSRDNPGRASGMLQAGAFAGGATGPVTFGVLADGFGFVVAWRLAGAVLLLSGLLALWARRLLVADLVARPPREPLGFGGGRAAPRRLAARDQVDGRRLPD